MKLAVIAHTEKQMGKAQPADLRAALRDAGFPDPLWFEVAKSKLAPKCARKAAKAGVDRLLVWGGDGTVRRCIDTIADPDLPDIPIGILPAGTANLLASSLHIPTGMDEALKIALHGERRVLDVGVINGERFAVMAGTGFDALLIGGADTHKDRFGRLAYIWAGLRASGTDAVRARIKVDGTRWFDGPAGCLLVGNVGTIMGGLEVFPDARPNDGRLEVGVVTAHRRDQWLRVFGRLVGHHPQRSPFVRTTSGTKIRVQLDRPMAYELDGGDRPPADHFRIDIQPAAITILAPPSAH
ncbi:MAG: diacylglycerol/lipid kinase family protein [Acidimicrobiales bacterium]